MSATVEQAMQEVESKWLRFVPSPIQAPRTEVWLVCAKEGGGILGEVKWIGRWRRYGFYPTNDSVYEQDCLRDIAGFVEQRTTAHKARRNHA